MATPSWLRILDRVIIDDNGCWIFPGETDGRGYGRLTLYADGKKRIKERTHRIMYMAVHGPIPKGMVVRHKCDVKLCCNPYHLELGTKSDNAYDYHRRQKVKEVQAAKTASEYRYDEATGKFIEDPPF